MEEENHTMKPMLDIADKPVVTITRKAPAKPKLKEKPKTSVAVEPKAKRPETPKAPQAKAKQHTLPTAIVPSASIEVLDNSEVLSAPIFKDGDDLAAMQKNTSEFFKSGTTKLFKRAVEEENQKLDALVQAEYRPIEEQDDEATETQLLNGSINFV